MKNFRQIVLVILVLIFFSCQTDSEKADKLRLNNKFEEAFELYQKASDEGDAYAKWRLSNAYLNGDGVDRDKAKAQELLRQSAQAECVEAKFDLAMGYLGGWYGIKEDTERGKNMVEELVKFTDNSYVMSLYAGLCFFNEDKEKAMSILDKVKDKNNPKYLRMMGYVYLEGTDKIDIDVEKAVEYFIKAFKKGERNTSSQLSSIYFLGRGSVKKDEKKAIEWLERGIESNVADCMLSMGALCLSEDSVYQDIHNPQKGIELYKKAARHGSGTAYTQLGNLYYNGEYVDKDDKKAFKYYQEATKLESGSGAYELGFAYLRGEGCEKDIKKGIETWKLAVEYGSGAAANNLFCHYHDGSFAGGKRDKKLAKKYLLKAAELGDDTGCLNLGRQYYLGNDLMEKNEGQAFVYMQKAADAGNIDACSWLSFFYEKGIGVNKNPDKAKEYKNKTIAKEDREKINPKTSKL